MSTTTPERILLVDDDQALLDGFCRTHRKSYDLHTACGGERALQALASEGPFAVVVSDYQMPGMNGITFLTKAREADPEMVRMMLTGNADLQSAISAVNEGHIFRFLTKPCAPEVFTSCVDAALEQHRLRRAERVLLQQTVRGSIEVLAEVLALSNPSAFGRSTRVQGYVRHIAKALDLEQSWQYETAALLSQIGFVAVPADIIEKLVAGEPLSAECEQILDRHPAIARDLLARIPRLERVAEMVANQHLRHCDARSSGLDATALQGSQILAAALDFDEFVSLGATRNAALKAMESKRGCYDPEILKVLGQADVAGQRAVAQSLGVKDLRIGMVLDQDVLSDSGVKIVGKGNTITPGTLARLRNYADVGGVAEPLRVRTPITAGSSQSRVA